MATTRTRSLLLMYALLVVASCSRQADSLDTRDFTEPCTASCEHSLECVPERALEMYADVEACIDGCNDNTLRQWSEDCADFTWAAWECNASLTCEQNEAGNEDPESSPCHELNDAFLHCVFSPP